MSRFVALFVALVAGVGAAVWYYRAPADARGYRFPPLWGPDSFNDGAGMDHFQRSVGFIHRNMPRGTDPAKPQLTLQEAWDAAALLHSRPAMRSALPREAAQPSSVATTSA